MVHHRIEPVDHRFSYRITMAMLDLAEVDAVCDRHPLWSDGAGQRRLVPPAGLPGGPAGPLDHVVRDLVEERTGRRPGGPDLAADPGAHLGLAVQSDQRLLLLRPRRPGGRDHVVEVTNTPWHERTAYVLPGPGSHLVDKQLHVSPFLPMDLSHRFIIGEPGPRLVLGVDDLRGPVERVFSATMVLHRRPVDRRSLGRVLWRYPADDHAGVVGHLPPGAGPPSARAYPFHPHPDRSGRRTRSDDGWSTARSSRVAEPSGRPLPPTDGVPPPGAAP